MSNGNIFHNQRYYALALDPIHVGTGGYRLGRVDLSIIREPSDNLPKIPGSSISGVTRAYTAMRTGHYCAGKGGAFGEDHCGESNCPVCVSFGFSKGQTQQSLQGMAQFFDARVIFFPVHSMAGPVWATAPAILRQAGMENLPQVPTDQVRLATTLHPSPNQRLTQLNLGWLLLQAGDDLPTNEIGNALPDLPTDAPVLEEVFRRLVLLSDELFSKVVNDNLEVRTSVAIDPATGAADDKALFTYEAMPRATVLHFDVVYNNPQHFQIGGQTIPHNISWVQRHVEQGLALMQHLGVGGMNTRGMGRLQVLNLEEV
ncbi:MAG: type III-B CRISPR module RAMP protein Cmr4 [Chloroflexota bacterium]|nr:type III-B CRISPR module RAMP protein Cmr4 [Chloroflexota bacterium]